MNITKLFGNIRFYVLLFSFFLSLFVYIYYKGLVGFEYNLLQSYALIAVFFLYVALLIGPFAYNFKTKFNSKLIKARRAIGISAFYFALLHATIAFFWELGGLEGLLALAPKYQLAIALSETALIILFLMAATSFDFAIKFMTFKRWKLLHRLVYAGSIFILIHALIIGSHFQNFSNWIAWTSAILISFLLFLEGKRILSNIQSSKNKSL